MSDEVCLRTFASRTDAEIAEAQLRSAGVDAYIVADDAGGAAPHIAYVSGGARLMVRREDIERAQQLLQESEG
jgi:hypothetical protein